MAGYDQFIQIDKEYVSQAKNFLEFLKNVGKKFARPTKFKYRTLKNGSLYIKVDGSPGGIDAVLQEMTMSRGLYYYCCSLAVKNKKQIVRKAIIPVYQQLVEYRFVYPYSRFINQHIIGKIAGNTYIPGDFRDLFSHEYEIIFRRWDLGTITNFDFVKDIDSLLTRFMLTQLQHPTGKNSPQFHVLVDHAYRKGVGMAEEIKGLFNKIHNLRTQGLHRLKDISHDELSELSFRLYNFFQFFDEFIESQSIKMEKLHGKYYRRIKWGDEKWVDENGEPYKDENGIPYNFKDRAKKPCHDCAAILGQFHCTGCDNEQCPRCKGQFLSCGCKLELDY